MNESALRNAQLEQCLARLEKARQNPYSDRAEWDEIIKDMDEAQRVARADLMRWWPIQDEPFILTVGGVFFNEIIKLRLR